ncbi:Uncharacterized protein YR821_1430 [Yersinia ruckeri]|uniref:Uncharacterized protein n=1 Tax=Yersinia ruckeri TaxID=29486 RepID=A0A0A8VH45_YERRU|nr:hypothetical protein yruck0001_18180 [Yersinia ruckeri ATCC 29473]QTD76357.1 Uncharacterized protein YR821_1430 [Yersinia ruckeri]CEK27259.1 hypothetical protein CSF007_7515 [Yersinia ruckeri]
MLKTGHPHRIARQTKHDKIKRRILSRCPSGRTAESMLQPNYLN